MDKIIKQVKKLRDLAYDSGWWAGAIEQGFDADASFQQKDLVKKRNQCQKDLLSLIESAIAAAEGE